MSSGRGHRLFDLVEKFIDGDRCVPKGNPERVSIDLVVERNDNPSTVGMNQLDVTALAMRFDESESLKSRDDLPTRKQRQAHKAKSTTSHPEQALISSGSK
jgi:hypothetical protein